MTIRAITFDLDDTLWPIRPVILNAERALRGWLDEHCPAVNRRFDQAAMMALRAELAQRHPERQHDLSAMRLAVLTEAITRCGYDPALAQDGFKVFFAERNRVELYPEVSTVLAQLSREFPLASLSNGNADLELVGIDSYFAFSLNASTEGKPKPHARMFLAASRRFGLRPDQILHVGDDLKLDAVAANQAGLHSVWLNRSAAEVAEAGVVDEAVTSRISCLSELRAHVADRFAA